jgi:hemerythrin-like domain-containing protein
MTNELVVLIDRLESEHDAVLDAVALIRSAVEERDDVALKGALAAGADELGTPLTVHSETEDNDLFPQLAAMIGEGLVNVFVEEHVRIRELRDQVYERIGQGEADFEGCAELCDLLSSHMERENQVLFPAARGVLAD